MTKLTTAARSAVRDRSRTSRRTSSPSPCATGRSPGPCVRPRSSPRSCSPRRNGWRELAVADEELSNLLRHSGDGAGDDQADSGSSALEREQELTLVNNVRDLLAQTSHALDRIAAGTYATCEETGLPIGKARLQAFPRANLSVEAKQRAERR